MVSKSESLLVLASTSHQDRVFRRDSLTLRDNTERPITTKLGTNQVVGTNPTTIIQAYRRAVNGDWRKPVIPPLWDGRAAERIVKTLLEEL